MLKTLQALSRKSYPEKPEAILISQKKIVPIKINHQLAKEATGLTDFTLINL